MVAVAPRSAGKCSTTSARSRCPWLVIVQGEIELIHPSDKGDTLIQVLGPGQFTGELNLLSGRRALARARVRAPGEVIEVSRAELLLLVQTDFELSEILMRAFILRRVALMERGLGDVVLIGSQFCSGTLRVKQFLARNAHPYSYIDLEDDAEAQHLLDRLNVSVNDIPILICRGRTGAAQSQQPSRLPNASDSTNPSTRRMSGTC